MNLLDITTQYVFFTGKGGVGKTSNAWHGLWPTRGARLLVFGQPQTSPGTRRPSASTRDRRR
jgi:anion-transporting  ArsA/GET3 family ATPase